MSNLSNTNLEERAREMAEEYTGTPLQDAILNNLDRGDLEMVQYLVEQAEAEMSRREFHNNDSLPEREAPDVY